GLAWDGRGSRALGSGRLSGAWELVLGHWRGTAAEPASGVTQVGLTPLLRWTPAGSPWFAEAGIGLHLVSPRYRNGDKRFGTRFNFGDVLAVGRRLGGAAGAELSLRLQHFSNGGLRRPNPGEEFLQLRLAWAL
ncbi:acyloxyacyl hydrolase, partial [Piscinibacter sakaiensis]